MIMVVFNQEDCEVEFTKYVFKKVETQPQQLLAQIVKRELVEVSDRVVISQFYLNFLWRNIISSKGY